QSDLRLLSEHPRQMVIAQLSARVERPGYSRCELEESHSAKDSVLVRAAASPAYTDRRAGTSPVLTISILILTANRDNPQKICGIGKIDGFNPVFVLYNVGGSFSRPVAHP